MWPQQNRRQEDLPAIGLLSLLGGAAISLILAKVPHQEEAPHGMGREALVRVGHCHECGYDLRGAPGKCPECGTTPLKYPPAAREGRLAAAKPLAEESGVQAEGILFVYDAFMARQSHAHRGAALMVREVGVYARNVFSTKDEALGTFHRWGIHQSENLGRVTFAMVRAGWLRAAEKDAEGHFDGLGTIEKLLEQTRTDASVEG
jgi:uncharacterized repeat protein (TIGR04138 family)